MEGAILNLLSKFSSPILDEFGLLWGMEKEQQKLRSNLLAIEAGLQDAEARQVKEKAVKDWLRKMRDVAYDADDLIDEFMVEALRRKVEIRDGMLKKVHNFFSLSYPLKFRVDMAHKMQELRERLDEIAEEKDKFHFKERAVEIHPPISRTRETYSYVIESEVYGRDHEKADIIDSLINSSEDEVLSVNSVVGMGGLGKTTLAQLVFNDERVDNHFGLKIWVYVSEDFDVRRLMREILQPDAVNDRSDPLSMEQLQIRLRNKLSGNRYLLVLDDVWNQNHAEWDQLKTILKCGAQGSKIIVTTRSNAVASIMGTLPAHHLETLSENDAWSLFEKLAHPDPKWVSMGKEMVGKCGGLPLAIKVLGGLMSSKRSESEWLSVRNSELWESQDTNEEILPSLRLSYNHLTPHLKQCFAYCAVFCKGYYIGKNEVVRQWVAQGFIQSEDENKLLEEKGEDFFNDLLARSLFQVAWKDHEDNVIMCKMHDLTHDLLRSVVGTESFNVEVSTQIVPKETRHLSLCDNEWAKESKNLEALEKCKKLRSMLLYCHIDVNVCSHFKYLRVLDLSGAYISYWPDSLGKLKHLRYLDISNATITKLPETICNLHSLQTLVLHAISLKKLPKDIKRMTCLRHIEWSSSTQWYGDYGSLELPMPNGIGELTRLQTLPRLIISQDGGGIEELKCLNQLRGELCIKGLGNIRNEKCAREAKLMEKKRLRSLMLSWSNNERITYSFDSDNVIENLEPHSNLQELPIQNYMGQNVDSDNVIENLEPHSNLQELSIQNYMGSNFPSWIKKLTNLVKVSLYNCKKCERLPPLVQLPLLEALDIQGMESVKCIFAFDEAYNNEDIFPSLKVLKLYDMPGLEGWWPHQVDNVEQQEERHEQVLLGRLRTLIIKDCPKLNQLPRLLFSPVLEGLELINVGCDKIEMPILQSLRRVGLHGMEHLEVLSIQQAHGLEELHISRLCPRMIHLPHFLPSLKELSVVECKKTLIEFIANYFLVDNLSVSGSSQVMYSLKGRSNASLPRLEIDDCPKSVSPSNMLKNLSTLKALSISDFPDLMRFPDELEFLGSLKGLFLPSLRILELYGCKNLESLYCDGLQNVTCIKSYRCPKMWSSSDWVKNLTSLDDVVIDGAESLPESFGNLISLRSLQIANSPALTALPESIGSLKSLVHLKISECIALTCLPNSIGNLTSLTNLIIGHCNAIRSLPESIGNLISLKDLRISSRCPEIRALPESIGNLTSLTRLTICGCDAIRSLPESIENLISLRELHISSCLEMRALPESIGKLTSLETLIIGLPCLTALTESIGNVKSLNFLWIHDCDVMKSLPKSMGNIISLKKLWIINCPRMETLPVVLQSLTNLETLVINKCPVLKRRLLNKKKKGRMGEDWHKVAHVPEILIDHQDPRRYFRGEEESNENENGHKCSSLLHCIS